MPKPTLSQILSLGKPKRVRIADIPGAGELITRTLNNRNAAFLDLTTTICQREVLPMTIRHWVILDGIDSPFVHGETPQPHDIPMFLWVMSRDFRPGASWRRGRFIRSVRRFDFPAVTARIMRYVEDTFLDSPPGELGDHGLPQISFAAGLVSRLAFSFHWTEAEILNIPLKRLNQYLKAVSMINDPDGAKFNPWDKLIRDGVLEMKEKLKAGGRG